MENLEKKITKAITTMHNCVLDNLDTILNLNNIRTSCEITFQEMTLSPLHDHKVQGLASRQWSYFVEQLEASHDFEKTANLTIKGVEVNQKLEKEKLIYVYELTIRDVHNEDQWVEVVIKIEPEGDTQPETIVSSWETLKDITHKTYTYTQDAAGKLQKVGKETQQSKDGVRYHAFVANHLFLPGPIIASTKYSQHGSIKKEVYKSGVKDIVVTIEDKTLVDQPLIMQVVKDNEEDSIICDLEPNESVLNYIFSKSDSNDNEQILRTLVPLNLKNHVAIVGNVAFHHRKQPCMCDIDMWEEQCY